MFLVHYEELRINHLTPFLVVTMPFACWFLWRAYYIEDSKWHLHFQFGVAFWEVVLREVYFEEPNHVWRALKTSILNIGWIRLLAGENPSPRQPRYTMTQIFVNQRFSFESGLTLRKAMTMLIWHSWTPRMTYCRGDNWIYGIRTYLMYWIYVPFTWEQGSCTEHDI